MSGDEFLNRTQELRTFLDEIAGARPTNRVILLEGASGIGKSSLTRRVLAEQRSLSAIKVPLLAGLSPDGYLISEAARIFSACGAQNGYATLQEYVVGLPPGSEIRRRYHTELLSTAASLDPTQITGMAATMFKRKRGLGEYSADQIFQSYYGDAVSLLADYLKHVLAKHPILLNIENIQDADRVSLVLLRELLSVQNGHYVILEYTPGEGALNDVEGLLTLFRSTARSVERRPLGKLPYHDARKLFPDSYIAELAATTYEKTEGNLRALKDAVAVYGSQEPPPPASSDFPALDPTPARIARLNRGALLTLCCVVAHRGAVKKEMLYALFGSHELFQQTFVHFDRAVSDLCREDMIHERDSLLSVAHDSIARSVLDEKQFLSYLVSAYETWSRVYTELNDRRDYTLATRSEILSYLFHFYAHTDPARLLGVLDEVREVALASLRPGASLLLLRQLNAVLTTRGPEGVTSLQRVYFQLLDLYYLLGLFEQGHDLLINLPVRSAHRDVYEIALLVVQDRDAEAIIAAEAYLAEPIDRAPWYRFFLQLFLMVAFRCVERMEDCERLFSEMFEDSEYACLPEYGLLLRNAEIVMPNDDAIPYLQESVDFFLASGKSVPEAQSRISLGVNYTIAGRLEEALTQFDIADELLRGRSMKQHITLNDRAVVHLLESPPRPDRAVEQLTRARRTVTAAFDEIVVLNNLMIAHVLERRLGLAEEIGNCLLEMAPAHPFLDLQRITYRNLAYLWESMGSTATAVHFRSLASSVGGPQDEYLDEQAEVVEGIATFISQYPFRPAFLANWDTELSDFIPVPH